MTTCGDESPLNELASSGNLVDNVTYVDRFNGYARAEGILHITLTHVFFIDRSGRYEVWMQTSLIGSVERLPLTATGAPLVIRGKDFRVACFLVSRDRDCQDVYETLLRLTQTAHLRTLKEVVIMLYPESFRLESNLPAVIPQMLGRL
ncbi:unnamed protein product [Dibothriocephalus latus]|uniref:MTMR6-9 GRAM domain-containing protein n=1 Tax=Dibothriocephalus latus TaxID=60516 RepID=A0A3P7LNX3_DIBLA|nr:unnamed protein product [Dibothriocephalus latus]